MTTSVANPEWLVLNRTLTKIKQMAAEREFVPSIGEPVHSVGPLAVFGWRTLEGTEHNQQSRFIHLPNPCILITALAVRGAQHEGVNCADDEAIPIVIQIVDTIAHPMSSLALRTYGDWMNRMRHAMIADLTLFRQDFDPATADPFLTKARDRVPADPQKLWSHDQQVAAFSFVVYVRHHHTAAGEL